uniref:Uncharacterized protein n=1 Tax=Tanacetum cinerariifolium TaxID=118510 RepID=A0A6L2LYZ1_TANCI|nr:hypothetical protein [Tanacetum cinerariifolium]
MDHQYPTVAKIPVLDTGKFEQWQFRIQQYLQHEHYALWEVIEFGDSYKVPTNTDPDDASRRKDDEQSRRTVTITTEDMQRKKNDVKARTTLLLSLLDEHQLRFSKYKTAKELWAAILKTFSDTMSLDDLYNHLKVYEAKLQKKSNSNSQNMAFISSSKNDSNEDGNTTSSGKRLEKRLAYKDQMWQVLKNQKLSASTVTRWVISQESALKALMAIDGVGWDWSYMANEEDHALVADGEAPIEFALMANTESKGKTVMYKDSLSYKRSPLVLVQELEEVKLEKDGLDGKLAGLLKASKNLDHLIESQRSDQVKEGVGYNVVPPPAADLYLSPKKDLSWTGLLKFVDDIVTDYSRPSPTIESTSEDGQNRNSSASKNGEPTDSILSKPAVTFVKAGDRPAERPTTNKAETVKKPNVKYAEMYRRPPKKPIVRGNQRN